MVVAVDAGNAFGSAEALITARKPLMVRPSAPRFLNFGDQVELPIVLQNQTEAPDRCRSALRGTNVRFIDAIGPSLPDAPDVAVSSAGKRVRVPANDRVRDSLPCRDADGRDRSLSSRGGGRWKQGVDVRCG